VALQIFDFFFVYRRVELSEVKEEGKGKSEGRRGYIEEGRVKSEGQKKADPASVSKIRYGSYSIKIIRKRVIMPDLSCIMLFV
jgi:hypothetical protein